MNLQDILSKDSKIAFCDQLLNKIEQFGLGSFSKADMDALIYHHIDINKKVDIIEDSYGWIRFLKVTPTKLRSLQLIASVKYLNLDDTTENWTLFAKSIMKKKIEIDDAQKGTVRFFIDNTHTHRFIEKFVMDNGSGLDYQRNSWQVVLKYGIYIDLMKKLKENLEIDGKTIVDGIEKDKNFEKIKYVFNEPMHIFESFKEKFKDKAFDEIAKTAVELVTSSVIKFVKNKVLGK